MPEKPNLARKIEERLPESLRQLLTLAAETAHRAGLPLYLVGGMVRDLLVSEPDYDLDLTVEGDAAVLAGALAAKTGASLTLHSRFRTARLTWDDGRSIDLTSARRETYAHPGALPDVSPGTLADDLFRRDFTVNALAVSLSPESCGEVIDLYGGLADLKCKLIRILHERSFIDDATRIWRALRYAARLGFSLETETYRLLQRDVDCLRTISGDRIRYELECVFKEKRPEEVISLAADCGVLSRLHPCLKGNNTVADRFRRAREMSSPSLPSFGLYLTLLVYDLPTEAVGEIISCLHPDKETTAVLRALPGLKRCLPELEKPGLAPSKLYHLLEGFPVTTVRAALAAGGNDAVRGRLRSYLAELRPVKLSLNGSDLKQMGVPEGPEIREVQRLILDARLDGRIRTKEAEVEMVRGWLAGERG